MAEDGMEAGWEEAYQQVMVDVAAWRREHPRATFTEIEKVIDERMNQLRAQMLTDTAVWSREAVEREAVCPACGQVVRGRGKKKRSLQTQGGESVTLEREHAVCERCGEAFFPPG